MHHHHLHFIQFDEQHLPKSFDCKVVELNSESPESELDESADARAETNDARRAAKERIKEASKRLKSGSEIGTPIQVSRLVRRSPGSEQRLCNQ